MCSNPFIFWLPVTSVKAQTIPNSGFENWTTVLGQYENPDYCNTNNAASIVSVSKTTDSYSGMYALQITNNAPSFEGPLPGYATTVFTSPNNISAIEAYVKCDSISGTGEGRIYVYGYLGTAIHMNF